MPTTYSKADPDVINAMLRAMAKYHPRLHDAQVRVGVLMAHNPDGPAIKHGGYPALACIRPVSLKDRLSKGYDAEMLIDFSAYLDLRPGQQEALMDHELSHIDTVDLSPDERAARDEGDDVTWKTDDLGRPKLRSVKGDWSAGDGFAAVVARHGADAIEFENIARCRSRAEAARREGESERQGSVA